MKRIIITSAALALLAGSASASQWQLEGRQVNFPNQVTAKQSKQVPASAVYSSKELQKLNLSPTKIIDVTTFPSDGKWQPRRHQS